MKIVKRIKMWILWVITFIRHFVTGGADSKATVKHGKNWFSRTFSAAKRNKYIIFRVSFIAISVFLVCFLLFDVSWQGRGAREQELVREIAQRPPETPAPTPTPEPVEEPEPEPEPKPTPTPKPRKPNERDINFEELREINPDVIGWIEIPGTKVDYPFVTTFDNDLYLDIDLFGNRNPAGTIFADVRNHPNMEDPFIVLYGHNMVDGSKFGTLSDFRDESFFNNNRRLIIYTPEGQLEYRIFAAYFRDDEHIMGTRNFRNPAVMQAHLDELSELDGPGTVIDLDGITGEDSILVLSTCTASDVVRYVIQAVFVEP